MSKVPRIAIVGGGFSGLCAAIQLKKQLGISPQIFEATHDLGGTWYHNTYPGCACDVPSHLYSLSFEINTDWSERFSSQKEIHEYTQKVAQKYDLYSTAMLDTIVVQATWLDTESKWKLDWKRASGSDEGKEIYSSYFDIVIGGFGTLRKLSIPEQFKNFSGPILHTGRWDSTFDFTGKRVAVVGSGASAIQTIPELAQKAVTLTSYQRTPSWVMMRKQYRYSALFKFLLRWVPFFARLYRFYLYLAYEIKYVGFGYFQSFAAKSVQAVLIKDMTKRLESQGRSDLVPLLIPKYRMGCKRIAQSENYLEALCRANVTVEVNPIISVKGQTITTADGKSKEYDVLVLATGFDTQGFLGEIKVYGKDNVSLNEKWAKNYPDTFNTVAVHGYPNFFTLLGPGSLLGHNSVLIMVECQVNYVVGCIQKMLKNNIVAIEPKKSAQDQFVAKLKKDLSTTVWTSGGCSSWYQNSKGEVTALWSSTVTAFWWKMRTANLSDFIQYTK